jgi:autotransporter translocation and assembly factor TamB
MSKGKIIFKRTIKVLIYLLLTLAVILLSLWFFINSNYGKHFIKNQAQHYLQQKLKTKIYIGQLNYDIPNEFELGNIYIEDKNKDTLLFAEKIKVSIKMLDLLDGQVKIDKILLSDFYANLYSSKEKPEFNYQFIIDAFADNNNSKISTKTNNTTSLEIAIKNAELNKIRISYKDVYGGTDLAAAVSKSTINFNTNIIN